MNICFVKKIVLFVSPLLFAISLAGIYTRQTPYTAQTQDESFLKQAWGGWSGPCEIVRDPCGGFTGGSGYCTREPHPDCSGGICPSACPQGTRPTRTCRQISGSCNHHMFDCARKNIYKCVDIGLECDCDPNGRGIYCRSQGC